MTEIITPRGRYVDADAVAALILAAAWEPVLSPPAAPIAALAAALPTVPSPSRCILCGQAA